MAAINGHADGGRLKMTELNLVKVSGKVEVKVPAVEKLVDYVASGVGAIAGPMLAPWRASREGKARIITAETDAKFQQIQAAEEGSTLQLIAKVQAEARESVVPDKLEPDGSLRIGPSEIQNAMEFQAKKRLMNVGAIAGHAAEELKGKEVSDHDPDPDWIARFFDGAQDVSSEELQKLWGRILAREVKSSGKTSLRTLSILKNMTQQEAQDFSTLMRFRIFSFIFNEGAKKILGDRFGFLTVHFSNIGLLSGLGTNQVIDLNNDGKWAGEHGGHLWIIEGPPSKSFNMSTGRNASVITFEGLEIAAVCQYQESDFSHFARFLAEQDSKLKFGRFIRKNGKNAQLSDIRIIEPFVEPEERDQQELTNAK